MPKNRRELPEINAGSMADIAFLLLVFFLVTTTMDVDTGITRKLPAKSDEPPVNNTINQRNIFTIIINENEELLVEDKIMNVEDLKDATMHFLTSKDDKSAVSTDKAIVSITTHRLSEYSTFIAVQDRLTAAYEEVRNRTAQSKFGKQFEDLDEDQSKEVRSIVPMNISEAEPVKG